MLSFDAERRTTMEREHFEGGVNIVLCFFIISLVSVGKNIKMAENLPLFFFLPLIAVSFFRACDSRGLENGTTFRR